MSLTAHIPSIGKTTTITRSVDKPSAFTLVPDTPEIRGVMAEVQLHPEFALSRREIIRYIISEPGKRSADVQELLRLSEIEEARKALTKISNDERKDRDSKEQVHLRARNELMQTLGIQYSGVLPVLMAVNERRLILQLPPLEKLEVGTSFKTGITTDDNAAGLAATMSSKLNKEQVTRDVEALKLSHDKGIGPESAARRAEIAESLAQFAEDSAGLRRLRQQTLIQVAMKLLDEGGCPLCDKEWEREALRQHLSSKLQAAQQTSAVLLKLRSSLNAVVVELDAYAGMLSRVAGVCGRVQPPMDPKTLTDHKRSVEAAAKSLKDFVSDSSDIGAAQAGLAFKWNAPGEQAVRTIDACAKAVAKIPEVSDEEKAKDYLTLAADKYSAAVKARAEFKVAETRSSMAAAALELYEKRKDAILIDLYDKVAKDFTEYYRSLNREDEGEFVGQLIPSAAKLGFGVDFYGYGKFPPGAFHSEGHQDGMGLCLYLALMKHTLGDNFTFSVLDDVMMSIDQDHRRNVCKLLVREFPNTQFILTTHDRVWLRFMQTEKLVKNSRTFASWTVETGPHVSENKEVWVEIEDALQKGDVSNAAGMLRHHLEYLAEFLADSLKAEVPYRGNGQYTLEDLMPSAFSRWQKKLADAVKSAKSWGKSAEETRLAELLERVKDAVKRSDTERWAMNPNVHYNKWMTFGEDEFRAVVKAFRDVLATMQCGACESYGELLPRHTSAEVIKCNCGNMAINLVMKS